MFTGIVQAQSLPVSIQTKEKSLFLCLKRPDSFTHLTLGESISVDGLCLSLESFDEKTMGFTLGFESLRTSSWSEELLKDKPFNLERSLRLGDFVGGHLMTGHVDAMADVISVKAQGVSLELVLQLPLEFLKFIWKKSYLAVNGASLTVNDIKKNHVSFCLIPETLKQSNLAFLKEGDKVTFEVDAFSKALHTRLDSYLSEMKERGVDGLS